ncbi:MAG: YihY/virulence factor BrkB family protein [Clostridiales bacterium]|jgi:membrane protein|nr:YihY/virulence factor BrkB family protein [Clostridiales bacterium]
MKAIIFLVTLYKEVQKDDLISAANDLTYKMLLSLFPLLIFFLSILSYFDVDASRIFLNIEHDIPGDVMTVISPFLAEILEIKRPSVLSVSLIFTLYSASTGFIFVMKGIHKAYGEKDSRNFFTRRLVSVWLVFVFAVSIVLSMVMLIFNRLVQNFIIEQFPNLAFTAYLFSLLGYALTILVLLISVLIINRVSLAGKQGFKALLPGAVFTVVCWVLLSKGFNIYVNNFSRYSAVYGSVAGVMILMIWLNLMCAVLLIGSEINAMAKPTREV